MKTGKYFKIEGQKKVIEAMNELHNKGYKLFICGELDEIEGCGVWTHKEASFYTNIKILCDFELIKLEDVE